MTVRATEQLTLEPMTMSHVRVAIPATGGWDSDAGSRTRPAGIVSGIRGD